MKKPFVWSLASAIVWIGAASVVAYAVSPIHSTPLDAAKTFAGGIVAAPVIGLLVGHIARRFSHLTRLQRFAVALADLYLATYLFLVATGVGHIVRDRKRLDRARPRRHPATTTGCRPSPRNNIR